MSQSNMDRLRAGYEGQGIDLLSPDFELHQASSIIDTAGVFRGRDAIRDVLSELQEAFEDFGFEAENLVEAPNGEIVVLVRARGRGRASGAETDNRIAHVWTFRDDKAVRMVVHEDQAEAFKAVGMRE